MGVQPPTQGQGGRGGSTFAHQQHAVVGEPCGALAAEAPNLVDADPAGTDGRDLPTLVNVCGGRQHQGQPRESLGTLS